MAVVMPSLQAQVTTNPVGYMTWKIQPGTGSGHIITPLAIPLYVEASSVTGAVTGAISSVSEVAVTVGSAGWSPSELSVASAPYAIRLTSGAAEGRNLLISANTDTTATINLAASGVSGGLVDLGVVAGDTYQLIECDTLGSVFGVPSAGGIVGGATLGDGDNILLVVDGILTRCYYDTDLNYWTKSVLRGNGPDLSNSVIMPDSGMLFFRKDASASSFILTGRVPSTKRDITINGTGVTLYASAWPVDTTLAATGISNAAGWRSSDSTNVLGQGDTLKLFGAGGVVSTYYHDGSNWRKLALRGSTLADDEVIPAGSAVLISKKVSTSDAYLSQAIPYTL